SPRSSWSIADAAGSTATGSTGMATGFAAAGASHASVQSRTTSVRGNGEPRLAIARVSLVGVTVSGLALPGFPRFESLPLALTLKDQVRSLVGVGGSAGALAAVDAERAQLLVQVGALDAERLRRTRDVPIELRESDADELALHLFAELAQALARVAA